MRTALLFLALAAALCGQNFDDYKVVRVAAGLTFAEGPAWSPEGYMIFSDVPEAEIWRISPMVEGQQVHVELSNGTNGNVYDGKGRRYSCETRTRRLTRTDKRGRVEVLLDSWEGKRLNGTNDVVVRKDGNIYFTDPAFGKRQDTMELDFYGVFHIDPKGAVKVIAKPEGRPNGIGLSPDGNILYVSNTDERRVYAYDLDVQGAASNERVLIENIDGPPDGITVDVKGNIYVTANHLPVYTANGKLLYTIRMAERPSNVAFGDPDLMTLYITARTSMYGVRLGVKGALQY